MITDEEHKKIYTEKYFKTIFKWAEGKYLTKTNDNWEYLYNVRENNFSNGFILTMGKWKNIKTNKIFYDITLSYNGIHNKVPSICLYRNTNEKKAILYMKKLMLNIRELYLLDR